MLSFHWISQMSIRGISMVTGSGAPVCGSSPERLLDWSAPAEPKMSLSAAFTDAPVKFSDVWSFDSDLRPSL